jgi:hypothetical protein
MDCYTACQTEHRPMPKDDFSKRSNEYDYSVGDNRPDSFTQNDCPPHYFSHKIVQTFVEDSTVEIQKLLSMDFKKKKDGTPDGRCKDYRRLMTLANGSEYNLNLDGSPDKRFTKNPEILKFKLAKILESKRQF